MIVTAYSDVRAAVDAINVGKVSRYIAKPWQPEELMKALKAAIDLVHFRRMSRDLEMRLLQSERAATALTLGAQLDHEMKNWLQVIHSALYNMRHKVAGLRPAEIVDDLVETASDGLRAVDVVRRLLKALVSGGQPASGQPLEASVGRVVAMVTNLVRGELEGIAELEVDIEEGLVALITTTELAQVLLNLVLNARDAITRSSPGEHRVTVRARGEPELVTLSVSDTGPGIESAQEATMFSPYVTTNPGREARGLGLAIVKTIVDERGKIRVESIVGEGTTITIELTRIGGPPAHEG